LCVGHAHVHPVRWNCEVAVFGRKIAPGDLIHADKHGFIVIAPDEQPNILEASRFMDANECQTVIPAARNCSGLSTDQILANLEAAGAEFGKNTKARFQRNGEW
jgi:regulator of RNase E activity RraA